LRQGRFPQLVHYLNKKFAFAPFFAGRGVSALFSGFRSGGSNCLYQRIKEQQNRNLIIFALRKPHFYRFLTVLFRKIQERAAQGNVSGPGLLFPGPAGPRNFFIFFIITVDKKLKTIYIL
jgi:hypothetical protein